eukprot:3848568-Prymnesium_polylepis.1
MWKTSPSPRSTRQRRGRRHQKSSAPRCGPCLAAWPRLPRRPRCWRWIATANNGGEQRGCEQRGCEQRRRLCGCRPVPTPAIRTITGRCPGTTARVRWGRGWR